MTKAEFASFTADAAKSAIARSTTTPVVNGVEVIEPDSERSPSSAASASARLVDLALSRYDVFVDDQGQPLAVRRAGGPNVALSFRAGRLGLRSALAAAYRERFGTPPSASALADALLVLEGIASEVDPRPVALRYGRTDNGEIVVDLADASGRAVIVSPDGWHVVERSPILFRRSELTGPMPTPITGGSLDELASILNMGRDSFVMLVAWMVASMVPEIPHPIMALFGEHGTAKSSTARLVSTILDPGPAPLRTAPRDVEQWAVSAAGSWLVALDNVSTIPSWLSDALCRAVTGDGMVRRQLYTDGAVSVLAFRRAVILTSIDAGALRGDLADRLVRIDLERITPRRRRTDTDIIHRYDRTAPAILGALLDLVAKVLKVLPSISDEDLPRMADFARIVRAVDVVLGTTANSTYVGQAENLSRDVVDGDPVASAVRSLMESHDRWDGAPSELLSLLTPRGDSVSKPWPTTAQQLSSWLKRCAPALLVLGIDVTIGNRTHTGRMITIEKARNVASRASHASDQDKTRDAGDASCVTEPGARHSQSPGGDGRDARDATLPHNSDDDHEPEDT